MIDRFIPELLIPVGGMEQLRAAVASGADAVYMGGGNFNARMNAENFSESHIENAICFAHENGVKVHITQNTLLHDDEMDAAIKQAVNLYKIGIDAIIVQDRGFADRIKSLIPELPLHLSTQGTVSDIGGALEAEKAGFRRVILARELSIDEIIHIRQNCSIEIEVFVHGAICICYSGQCHMSSFIGGRSGNRGQCAQPCRLPYSLYADGAIDKGQSGGVYLLSPADMYLLEHLEELRDAGVDSIKIEGRMRSPEYVASVTAAYRKALDDLRSGAKRNRKQAEKDRSILGSIYNRGDFTDAYLRGDSDMSLMSVEIPKHKGREIGKVLAVDVRRGHAEVLLTDTLRIGDGVELRSNSDSRGNIITYIRAVSKAKTIASNKGSNLIKEAHSGQRAVIGDLDLKDARLGAGSILYRTRDSLLMKEVKESYEKPVQRVDVRMRFDGAVGSRASLTVSACGKDSNVSATVKSEQALELARNRVSTEEDIVKQLSKTGGTPYRLSECIVNLYGDAIVPASLINGMRRSALEKLTELRLDSWKNEVFEEAFSAKAETDDDYEFEDRVLASESRASAELCDRNVDNKAVINVVFNRTGREIETAEALLRKLRAEMQAALQSGGAAPYEEAAQKEAFSYAGGSETLKSDGIGEANGSGSRNQGNFVLKTAAEGIFRHNDGSIGNGDIEGFRRTSDINNTENSFRHDNAEIGASLPPVGLIIEFSLPYEKASELCELLGQLSQCKGTAGFIEFKAVVYLPAVLRQGISQDAIDHLTSLCRNGSLAAISLGHPSQLELFSDREGISLRLEESANLYNSYTFQYWCKRGIERATTSYELDIAEITSMDRILNSTNGCDLREVAVYGRIPLMLTAHCPVACGKRGRCLEENFALKDRKGMFYPLIPNISDCSCTILSYRPLNFLKSIKELSASGIKAFRVLVTDESIDYIYERIEFIIKKINEFCI